MVLGEPDAVNPSRSARAISSIVSRYRSAAGRARPRRIAEREEQTDLHRAVTSIERCRPDHLIHRDDYPGVGSAKSASATLGRALSVGVVVVAESVEISVNRARVRPHTGPPWPRHPGQWSKKGSRSRACGRGALSARRASGLGHGRDAAAPWVMCHCPAPHRLPDMSITASGVRPARNRPSPSCSCSGSRTFHCLISWIARNSPAASMVTFRSRRHGPLHEPLH